MAQVHCGTLGCEIARPAQRGNAGSLQQPLLWGEQLAAVVRRHRSGELWGGSTGGR